MKLFGQSCNMSSVEFLKPLIESGKSISSDNFSFILVFVLLITIITVMYSYVPDLDENCVGAVNNCIDTVTEAKESSENFNTVRTLSVVLSEHSTNLEFNFEENSCSSTYDGLDIVPNFIPDITEISLSENLIRSDKFLKYFQLYRYRNEGTEQEAITAVHMALKMKELSKLSKARKLFQHALTLQPLHPEVLNNYAEFLEENDNDIIAADHLYIKTLFVSPNCSKALINRKRTKPLVEVLDQQQLDKIDNKRHELIKLNHTNATLKRVKKEVYFLHIYHTLAIEGNTMTLAETRTVVETGLSIPGKSIVEHNEILGIDLALRFMNKTFVNNSRPVSVFDILEIHKRILGNVDPLEAGTFRRTQVFVGEHVPPPPQEVEYLMNQFVDWLQSDDMLTLHPVKKAALAHYRFAYIHPFVDGNGRTARLIMNLILMRAGYPPVIIRKQDRLVYYNTLQLANEGDIRPFIRFIAHCTDCTLNVFLNTTDHDVSSLIALEPKLLNHSDVISL